MPMHTKKEKFYLNELKKLEILHVDNYQYIESKKLNKDELKTLCSEIREFLIDSVSETGGHLASNLGIVELTVAIHTVFNVPEDKIVFSLMCIKFLQEEKTGSSRSVSSAECRDFRKQAKVIVTYLIPVTVQLQFQPHSVLPEGVTLPATITM